MYKPFIIVLAALLLAQAYVDGDLIPYIESLVRSLS